MTILAQRDNGVLRVLLHMMRLRSFRIVAHRARQFLYQRHVGALFRRQLVVHLFFQRDNCDAKMFLFFLRFLKQRILFHPEFFVLFESLKNFPLFSAK